MLLKTLWIISIGLCLVVNVFAQVDTIFLSIPSESDLNTVSYKVKILENGYGILNYNFDDTVTFYSLYKTDLNGNIVLGIDTLKFPSIDIISLQDIIWTGSNIVFLANVKLPNNENAFFSILMDPTLFTVSSIDTLQLEKDEKIIFIENFKFDHKRKIYENIGLVQNINTNEFISNDYISLSLNGNIINWTPLQSSAHPTYVMDFVRLEENNNYFVTFWDKTSGIYNSNFEVKNRFSNRYKYEIGDTTYITQYTFYGCKQVNNKVVCAGSGGPENEFNFSLAEYILLPDSFYINRLIPLLPQNTHDDIVLGNLTLDNDSNLICVGVGLHNPFNNFVDSNKIYITKISNKLDPVWQTVYSNGKELSVKDISSDQYGDIVIVGSHWSDNFPGFVKSFFLKLYHNGTFTSLPQISDDISNTFIFYPNPVSDRLHIINNSNKTVQGELWAVDGTLLKTFKNISCESTIDFTWLSPGLYLFTISDYQMKKLATNKLIKL